MTGMSNTLPPHCRDAPVDGIGTDAAGPGAGDQLRLAFA